MKELILGGIRSGKSRFAEQRALTSQRPITYIATALARDEEMRRRIAEHQARRPASWTVVEEPLALAGALRAHVSSERCVMVDCLTLWLTQLLCAGDDRFAREREALLAVLLQVDGHVILVSNETGLGIVPLGELSRRFCDEAGRLHQDLAQICDRVFFTVAGLPQVLKGAAL